MTTSLYEMHSNELGSLLEALAKAQAIMEGAREDSSNPFFKSSYADLTSVWQACREPLSKNGLSVIQTTQVIGEKKYLVSLLGHVSGQWIKSVLPIEPSKPDIQSLGSAITYSRRYTLASLVGVCPVDDDGEATMDRNKQKKDLHTEEANEPITFKLPSDVSREVVDVFIFESAKETKKARNDISKKSQ